MLDKLSAQLSQLIALVEEMRPLLPKVEAAGSEIKTALGNLAVATISALLNSVRLSPEADRTA